MDLNNLAIVFSPTILKNNSGDINLEMSDIQKLKRVTEVRDGFDLIIHLCLGMYSECDVYLFKIILW